MEFRTSEKDKIISLSHNYVLHFQIDETFSQERINALANARSEIASLQVRIDGLTSQVGHAIIFSSIEAEVKVRRKKYCSCSFHGVIKIVT